MARKITKELVQHYGAALRRVDISEARAEELTTEIERLNNTVFDAANARVGFNDEPAQFIALLHAAREGAKR